MRSALVLLPLAAVLAGAADPAPSAADLSLRPVAPHPTGDTDCGACHTAEGWRPVTFAHERTGFALEGRHREVSCKACHRGESLNEPIPRACSACHRDPHLGRLGQRCQDCHDPNSFASQTFGPEAHRRTGFPLSGRHALIACEECHGDLRDRGFSRPNARCVGCHEADLALATSGGAALDHGAAGFPPDCRGCHSTWHFTPALFAAHQTCFDIHRGPHARFSCRQCHTSTVPPVVFGQPLTCTSDTANCLICHKQPRIDQQHSGVAGYAPVNLKCYECHHSASP